MFTCIALGRLCGQIQTSPEATAPEKLKLLDGFRAELLYSVPKETQGSWVALAVDPQGRLIVSDQNGPLYRFRVPGPGGVLRPGDVEPIALDIGHAQGLLHAFGSLYVVVNSSERTKGLYRLRDADGDDKYDSVELLREFTERAGEHGPHAVLLGPDGKSLYVVCGNQTPLPDYERTRTPPFWGEDEVVPRIYGRGFMKGVLAPRGWIAKTDPDGKKWEIVATGFRNPYDAAFDRSGELFAYDADMEWDLNTPWYRPTRVNHVVSGADFGWRNGSHKWPDSYLDSFGAVINIGPGSPTGVAFGHGAKFPAKYQDALFICDWSYGKLHAVHLKPSGSTFLAEREEFVAGQPLPLTDLVVHPQDGALYVTVGGRKVQSGLYRITYAGKESTAPVVPLSASLESPARKLRHSLEDLHGQVSASAIPTAWPYLGHKDRGIRHAARVALEHQPYEDWKGLALTERDPTTRLAALVALARVAPRESGLGDSLLQALNSMEYASLSPALRLDYLRAYELVLVRHGGGFPTQLSAPQREAAIAVLNPLYPAGTVQENLELTRILANLGAPSLPVKGVELLESAPSQEEQLGYATNLRLAREGWTPRSRKGFFEWLVRAQTFRGGANLELFVSEIKAAVVAGLSEDEKVEYAELLNRKAEGIAPQFTMTARDFVKAWVTSDFHDVINVGLEGNRDFENGRRMFGAASCYACHRFNEEGGAVGPDLTSVAGKFSPMDLLESIIEPSKEISDQYGAMVFELKDGTQVAGRIGNLNGEVYQVSTNMFDPGNFTPVPANQVKSITPSPISMMPPGLIYTLGKEDVLDLLAYLLSKGNPEDPMFH
ncbi:MAG: Glucose/arabinose dehydrogenase, beta-propeller fold [Verrucomicrobia bacterium]|nr:MAG: Glucose/arabinose dehydrogenase, beta-propeller fold [Verrucomicrobiota bacterium]